MKISCVIPAKDEEENIPELVDKLVKVLSKYEETKDYEIVLVNDNSTDNTGKIIDELAKKNPRIRAVHRTKNPGFGNALKDGFKNATGDVIIPVMGDLSDDPEDIPKLVRKILEGYDVVYGSRFISGGSVEDYPRLKLIANRLFNNVIRLLFGIKHKDVTNAFKAYKREVLEEIGDLESEGFDLTVEIPLKAHVLGFKSAEVPVRWYGRRKGEAKLKLSRNALIYGRRLLKLFVWGNAVALKDLFSAVFKGSPLHIVMAILLGLIVLFGLFALAGISKVFGMLANVNLIYFTLSCISVFMTFIFRTWRWSVLLRTSGYATSRDNIFKCLMFGWFINYLVPARLGDVARGVALKTTERTPLSVGLATIVVERAMDMIVLAVLLIPAVAVLSKEKFISLEIFAVGIALSLVVVLIFAYKFDHLFVRLFEKRYTSIAESMKLLKRAIKEIYRNPYAIALCLGISVPVWLFEVLSIFLAARALSFNIPFSVAIVSGVVAFIVQAIPLTPAGIGVYEGAIASVLTLFGIPLDAGLTIALLDHLARGLVIYLFGALSTIHIGFASREY
ncbi:flippase-like domain-containing protein, partial [Archaeoglobus sp.]